MEQARGPLIMIIGDRRRLPAGVRSPQGACVLLARVLRSCLEWGPFFTRWPNVTQPYMRKFRCKTQ